MSDEIRVSVGNEPWAPAPDANTVEVLDRYDAPTSVLLTQNSTYYLGQALLGALADLAIWVYVPLGDTSVSRLLTTSGSALDSVIDSELYGHGVGVVVSEDRIVFAHAVNLTPGTSRNQIAAVVTRTLATALQDLATSADRVRLAAN